MNSNEQELTEEQALRAYARMINTLDAGHLVPLLSDGFQYASQMVFKELNKEQFIDYIIEKLKTFGSLEKKTRAEMAKLGPKPEGIPGAGMVVLGYARAGRPCVVVSQGDIDKPQGIVFAQVEGPRIKKLDICIVPPPSSAIRSGEFPE